MLEPKLDNKVVIVTGANNPYGIGAAVAKAFAKQGAKVFLHYFREQYKEIEKGKKEDKAGESFYYAQQAKTADEVLQTITEAGGQAYAWEADLAEASVIPELFEQAEKTFGPVEILINNAAYSKGDTFIPSGSDLSNKNVELWTDRPNYLSIESIDRHFAINTRAVALMMREFGRRHINRGGKWGRIMNISTAGAFCFPSEVSYGASKLALEGYTRSAAVEYGQFGITVNCISLGPIQTGWITPELEENILPTIPLARLGTPADVADAIILFASEQARWITGQTIYVGGGHGM